MLDALIENTLAQIDDLAELKVTLVALWLIERKGGGTASVDAADRGLVEAAAAILAVAFLAKAAMWPLGFWLVPAYSAAGAPVRALSSHTSSSRTGIRSIRAITSASSPWPRYSRPTLMMPPALIT